MHLKSFALPALIVVCAVTLLFELSHAADPQKAETIANSPFSGKVLVISEKSSPDFAIQLENPQLKRIGDKEFLMGASFDDEDEKAWANGRTVWIPIDDISQIVEFVDRAELKKADEKSNRRERAAALPSHAVN